MARRTGIPSLQALARTMCKFVVAFTPSIRKVTDNDPAVMLALETALAACAVLESTLADYVEVGD